MELKTSKFRPSVVVQSRSSALALHKCTAVPAVGGVMRGSRVRSKTPSKREPSLHPALSDPLQPKAEVVNQP